MVYIVRSQSFTDDGSKNNAIVFQSLEKAKAYLRTAFENTKRLCSHKEIGFLDQEPDGIQDGIVKWAMLYGEDTSAQIGIIEDNFTTEYYCWEITEENVDEPPFVITGCWTDMDDSHMYPIHPIFTDSEEEAAQKLRELYSLYLEKYGVEDNGTSDENGDAIPGGFCNTKEAGIWDYAPYACDCLVNVAMFTVNDNRKEDMV